ncbi:hypothetical protein KY333_03580 [Candidatus Woesearchaeota archaeon]|nr:hypothetical protein [Candidatus Woesearchaeota archaeon]
MPDENSRVPHNLLNETKQNFYCHRWADKSDAFGHLNLSIFTCYSAFGTPPVPCQYAGEWFCTYHFVYDGESLRIINASSLRQLAIPINTPRKALDFVKARLWSKTSYEKHFGNWIYDKDELIKQGCEKFEKVNMTNIKEVREGYEVTVLRTIQIQCVPPILFEEHYLVTRDGAVTTLTKKEMKYCEGEAKCYD